MSECMYLLTGEFGPVTFIVICDTVGVGVKWMHRNEEVVDGHYGTKSTTTVY